MVDGRTHPRPEPDLLTEAETCWLLGFVLGRKVNPRRLGLWGSRGVGPAPGEHLFRDARGGGRWLRMYDGRELLEWTDFVRRYQDLRNVGRDLEARRLEFAETRWLPVYAKVDRLRAAFRYRQPPPHLEEKLARQERAKAKQRERLAAFTRGER